MLSYRLATLSVVILLSAGSAAGQVVDAVPGPAGSLNVVVHVPTDGSPAATVLLLPGWGSGPTDVLGLAGAFVQNGVASVVLSPRGWHGSDGMYSHFGALDDIEAALAWIRSSDASRGHGLNHDRVFLGGHSWGGGFALAYAARDSSLDGAFSVGGTDHGFLARTIMASPEYEAMVRELIASTAAPNGPIRLDLDTGIRELVEGQEVFGLLENADRLASRPVLLLGGWEDRRVTVEEMLLPLYRALRAAGADDVTFRTYHANHGFGGERERMHAEVVAWILDH